MDRYHAGVEHDEDHGKDQGDGQYATLVEMIDYIRHELRFTDEDSRALALLLGWVILRNAFGPDGATAILQGRAAEG